jgi:hypothetical protein
MQVREIDLTLMETRNPLIRSIQARLVLIPIIIRMGINRTKYRTAQQFYGSFSQFSDAGKPGSSVDVQYSFIFFLSRAQIHAILRQICLMYSAFRIRR